MCTAITLKTNDHYFGRNLDLEYSFSETVTITPRNFPLSFRKKEVLTSHYAIIGIAYVPDNYPLYYDATNEKGLSMAGLNFPDNAVYFPKCENADNIASFELIPWILGQCANTQQALEKLSTVNITDVPYSSDYPPTPLHWFMADKKRAYTIESTKNGLNIYENSIGVLTNNPPFEYHMYNLSNYLNLTHEEPINRFAPAYTLKPYSRGMGAIGLPGDLSSSSRFVKAAFTRLNSIQPNSDNESISQFFHILASVAQQKGCVKIGDHYEKTIYSSCCDIEKGIYYYTTYENPQITGVSMHHTDINTDQLIFYPIKNALQIRMEN